MKGMNKIKELEEQLAKARREAEQDGIEKYKHLIGKCFRRAYTSFELVTDIFSSDEDEITYDCISIYINPEYVESAVCVDTNAYGSIEIRDIELYQIPKEDFDEMLQLAFRRISNMCKSESNDK